MKEVGILVSEEETKSIMPEVVSFIKHFSFSDKLNDFIER